MTDVKYTSTLYECRDCGGCIASEQLSCPYCGNSEGPTVTRKSLETNESVEATKAWYRLVRVQTDE